MIGGSTADAELAALSLWPNRAPGISADERLSRIARARVVPRVTSAAP